jgi:transcriptional regulator
MFHYPCYRSTDLSAIRAFVERFALATITTRDHGRWACSQVPLFMEDDGRSLFGHVDAANPQFEANACDAYVVFQGPDAYIPPEAYVNRQLPTWNYVSVHAQGRLFVGADRARSLEVIRATARRLARGPAAFEVRDDDVRISRWIGAVKTVRIQLDTIEGRFKLSQDKAAEDVASAARHFVQCVREAVDTQLLSSLARATIGLRTEETRA